LRRKVAREAALLLYTLQEKEYRQAKERAAKNLGARILPSNFEVAEELDKIADDYEGSGRIERLIKLRREALNIMEDLSQYHPRVIGSVWRGTANKNSDIDIEVFSSNPNSILDELRRRDYRIVGVETSKKEVNGEVESSTHIYVKLQSGDEAEIIIRKPADIDKVRLCEIYGDPIKGLTITELRRVLEEDPTRRFIPQ